MVSLGKMVHIIIMTILVIVTVSNDSSLVTYNQAKHKTGYNIACLYINEKRSFISSLKCTNIVIVSNNKPLKRNITACGTNKMLNRTFYKDQN